MILQISVLRPSADAAPASELRPLWHASTVYTPPMRSWFINWVRSMDKPQPVAYHAREHQHEDASGTLFSPDFRAVSFAQAADHPQIKTGLASQGDRYYEIVFDGVDEAVFGARIYLRLWHRHPRFLQDLGLICGGTVHGPAQPEEVMQLLKARLPGRLVKLRVHAFAGPAVQAHGHVDLIAREALMSLAPALPSETAGVRSQRMLRAV